jgi:hypothetical protein
MRIRNQQNFWSGVLFLAFGLFFAGFGTQYPMGTAARMGPAFFPFWLGTLLTFLGAGIAVGALAARAEQTEVGRFHLRELTLVLGAVVLFGLTLKTLGLVLALLLLIVTSSLASHEFRWKATLANAAVLIGLCLVVFIGLLKLVFPVWPGFLVG